MTTLAEPGGFLKKNILGIFAFLVYAGAAVIPFMGLTWNSPLLVLWSALLLTLLTISFYKLIRPVVQAHTDLYFVISLVLTLDLFSVLLGPDSHWIQPMNYVLIALCAVCYSLGFNFMVAALIFFLQMMGVISTGPAPKSFASLAVFGAYLMGIAIILGRLFQSEQKKKEKAVLAMRRIHEGAAGMSSAPGEEQLSSVSPQGRFSNLVETAAELDRVLEELLRTAKNAIPCDNALIFMTTEDEERLYLRLYMGDPELANSPEIALGQGLTGWVAKDKKPVLANDGVHGLGYLREDREVNAFLAVPIMNGGVLEGVIALDSSAGSFTDKDKETLSGFASLALHALRSARVYQRVDMSAKEFETLHRISAELSSSLDLKTILEKLATCAREIIAYDYLTVFFLEGTDSAAFRMLKGYDGLKVPDGPVPLAGSLLGWIAENRQELSLSDLDERTQNLPVFPGGLLKTEFKSFLGLPLLSHDGCMGVFTVAMRAAGAITAYQHQTLSIIANQVAVNISNAKYHHIMELMATTDGLTGLTNHRAFQEKADHEFERAQRYPEPIALLLFDIDHFKKINDTYGHPVGDAVLKRIGKLLNDTVRSVDVAARYGGEEFVALLVNTDSNGAAQMAERIRAGIEKSRFMLNGQRIPVTVSVGYAVFPENAKEKSALIGMADQALYAAKHGGRNQCRSYKELAAAGSTSR